MQVRELEAVVHLLRSIQDFPWSKLEKRSKKLL